MPHLFYFGNPTRAWQRPSQLVNLYADPLVDYHAFGQASRAAIKIGAFHSARSDFSHALSFYLKALYYVRDMGSTDDLIICLNNIAGIYISLGDLVKAQDYLAEAAKHVGQRSQAPFQPSLLINLGQLFSARARRSRSAEDFERALSCFREYLALSIGESRAPLELKAREGIAGVYVEQGRLDEARAVLVPALEDAEKAGNPPLVSGAILSRLGETALRSGDLAEGERRFREALALAEGAGNPLLTIKALYGLGRCAEARSDLLQALDFYDRAIRLVGDGFSHIVNDADRAEFIGRRRELYQAMIELCAKLSRDGDPEAYAREIFRLSEYFRARSFAELTARLARKGKPQHPGGPGIDVTGLRDERLALLKALSRGGLSVKERENLKAGIRHLDDMLDAALFERYLDDGASVPPAASVSPESLQSRVLNNRTALIEYFLGEARSFLVCVTKDSLGLAELPPAGAIADSLTAFLAFLEDPSIEAAKGLPAARRLYARLLSPAAGLIPEGISHLIIVPDGVLARLPFEALAFPDPDPQGAVYLIDRYSVSYAPSAAMLLAMAKTPPRERFEKDLLAVAVSKYPGRASPGGGPGLSSAAAVLDDLYKRNGFAMDPLPNARREVARLAGKFKSGKVDALYMEKAGESAFKSLDLKNYRIIHLACHAFSDDNHPLRSALVLSRPEADEKEDGFLQVSEMLELRTDADLVVLSACQTARGKIVQNEGVLGLPRAFFYMGARSVISTLWPIRDKAGAEFIRMFYEAYLRGSGKAEALRDAKRRMAATRYGHPFFWASYVLAGEF